jgi:hypothetical protein
MKFKVFFCSTEELIDEVIEVEITVLYIDLYYIDYYIYYIDILYRYTDYI